MLGLGLGLWQNTAVLGSAAATHNWSPSDVSGATLSNGNLTVTFTGAPGGVRTNTGLSTGKWYWEVHADNNGGTSLMPGIADSSLSTTAWWYTGGGAHAAVVYGGSVDYNGGAAGSVGGLATGDVIQFGYDADNKVLYVGRNGTWGLGNPATLTGGLTMGLTGAGFPACQGDNTGCAATLRTTAGSFGYSVPTGFTALG